MRSSQLLQVSMCEIKTITPFIARETSKDWDSDCRKLEQTIRSVMAMSPTFMESIIVGHDRPPFVSECSRVTWIQAPHQPPGKNASNAEKFQDIGSKMIIGIRRAYDSGNRWAMFLDADDLISRRLESLCELKNHDAIVLLGGYLWDPFTNNLRRSFSIHKSCGSTHLVRLDSRWFPYWLGEATSGPRVADQSHSDILNALIHAGARIQRIRSPMIAYRVGSANSMSRIKFASDSLVSTKSIKNLILQRRPSARILEEFSMPG